MNSPETCCNSFYFYIKPQLFHIPLLSVIVVIHSISTSNHNLLFSFVACGSVVIHSISTSNHNHLNKMQILFLVVIHSISTSNHNAVHDANFPTQCCNSFYFYIKPQLGSRGRVRKSRCNSFYFYIKPQPWDTFIVIIKNL